MEKSNLDYTRPMRIKKSVSYVSPANILCGNRVPPRRIGGVVNTFARIYWKLSSGRRATHPHEETEVRAPRAERSYVSTPNKNSFDIQIASAFFRRVVFVQGNCADFASYGLSRGDGRIYKRIKPYFLG